MAFDVKVGRMRVALNTNTRHSQLQLSREVTGGNCTVLVATAEIHGEYSDKYNCRLFIINAHGTFVEKVPSALLHDAISPVGVSRRRSSFVQK